MNDSTNTEMSVFDKAATKDKDNIKTDVEANKTLSEYVVYPVRWIILTIFALYSATNALHAVQYSIIQDAVVKYYGVSSITVYWTAMVYMLVYIPLIFPGSWLVDKMGLRVTTIIGAFGTCACCWLKVFSVSQDRFWLGIVGQVIAGISQVFVLSLPPKVAAVWFGADQVSTACSIGVFGYQVGVAVGFVLPPMLVHTDHSIEELAAEFQLMFYVVAGFTTVLLVAILLFFKAAPATPPSAAAELGSTIDTNFLLTIKSLFTNRNYILLLISYSINVGVYYAIAVVLNDLILPYYPGRNEDAGFIGLVFIIAGLLGSIVCGLVLDKTRKFKETTVILCAAAVAGMLLFTFTLSCGYIQVVYLTSALLGFFVIGYLAVGMEFASELTYPEPEGTTSGMLNAAVQVSGIVLTLLYEWMLRTLGDRGANLVLCGLLLLGTVLSAVIRPDLRRQAVQIDK